MAHRGRISILHNFLGKSLKSICNDFSEVDEQYGDVKYHLGTRAVVNVTYIPSSVDEYGSVGSFNSGGCHDDNIMSIITTNDSSGYLRNDIKMDSPNDEMIENSCTSDSRDSHVITTTTTSDRSSGSDSRDNSREKSDFGGGTMTMKMKVIFFSATRMNI